MTLPELAAAAADLAAQGVPVFPCGPDKRPVVAHGFKDAARTPSAARCLFLQARAAVLIGMPTGPPSGISAIDIDPQGMPWWAAKQRKLPETRVHQTRRGGYHLLFKHSPGLRNSASKIWFGVDVRGDGGYIIIPPSPGYSIINEVDPVDFPKSILRKLAKQEHKSQYRPPAHMASAVAPLARFVSNSRPGERNARLFWAACRLGEAGGDGEGNALIAAASSAGLDITEATRTVKSGIARGRGGGSAG